MSDNYSIGFNELSEYDAELKKYIANGLSTKANSAHSHTAIQIGTNDENRFTNTADINRLKNVNKSISLGSISGTHTIDVNSYNCCTATLTGATVFNLNATDCRGIKFVITNGAAGITWNSTIKWVEGDTPTYSSGTDIIDLVTVDGGSTWYASILQNFQ